ncbi:carbon starvation protein CstA [Aequitasia blattaphilus]|uniref:Carbon starvation protein A n=1 Tax=Aequitasia blattaphilus TaxID=2949332 RepID=A0ABT1EBR9_9FIRM|nr:carbon starvation protein A [Aequitasia blattaphilus]MCP1103089.1 carbon starvation protein A [Aequitasia blattaphilus]MCR8615729.1 carbon starvation protein A [Aequitasia blattaphilus]
MITFIACIVLLIIGYLTYGKFVDKVFGTDDRETPAVRLQDGVDYVPMNNKRIFLIQLLNIAGLGPITGAIQGALFGPVVYLWIVLGTIFAGGVHDYMTGMLSMRNNGGSISEIVGKYLGGGMKQVMRVFSVILLLMVGTVFAVGPSSLLAMLTPKTLDKNFWLIVVLIYYFLATLLPVDKLIGKIYPFFGVCLIIMAAGVGVGLVAKGYPLPEMQLTNMHPSDIPIWPFMFITVACGAISGFHATQSPMMARCLTTEKKGRQIFYGAMVAEGVIALVWAAAGVSFYESTGGLLAVLTDPNIGPNGAVYEICMTILGPVGGILAMIGVIACPISSGDTAFRSARLTIADWFKVDQSDVKKRLALTVPILGFGAIVGGFFDYSVIWRYFSWSNQTLAMIALWAAAVYLWQKKKKYIIAAIPATFMSAVSATYFLAAPECLGLMKHGKLSLAYGLGAVVACVFLGIFLKTTVLSKKQMEKEA